MADKKKMRLNIIDILIILAVIALAAGVALRYNLAEKIGVKSNRDTVMVSFLIENIKPTSADALVPEDIVFLDSNGMELGKLLAISLSEAENYNLSDEGVMTLDYDSTRCDVRGEIEATGAMTDGGFMLGGTYYIGANKELKVHSKNIQVTMTVTGIRESR